MIADGHKERKMCDDKQAWAVEWVDDHWVQLDCHLNYSLAVLDRERKKERHSYNPTHIKLIYIILELS